MVDLIRAIPCLKFYDWGEYGPGSLCHLLYTNGNMDLLRHALLEEAETQQKKANKPYAELWYGSHVSADCKAYENPNSCNGLEANGDGRGIFMSLNDAIRLKLTQKLSEINSTTDISDTNLSSLPFLAKFLSIRNPLSIQLHPNRAFARELHEKDPVNYKDANHKPEMLLPLNRFAALLGLQAAMDTRTLICETPEFALKLKCAMKCPTRVSLQTKSDLTICLFTELLELTKTEVQTIITELHTRLRNTRGKCPVCIGEIDRFSGYEDTSSDIRDLLDQNLDCVLCRSNYVFLYLLDRSKSKVDVGILIGAFCLESKVIKPGECIFIAPNIPHAYLYGSALEIMTNSDNVIRAGLTQKHTDSKLVASLLVGLQHEETTLDGVMVPGVPAALYPETVLYLTSEETEDEAVHLYKPPVQEFKLYEVCQRGVDIKTSSGFQLKAEQLANKFRIVGESGTEKKIISEGENGVTTLQFRSFALTLFLVLSGICSIRTGTKTPSYTPKVGEALIAAPNSTVQISFKREEGLRLFIVTENVESSITCKN